MRPTCSTILGLGVPKLRTVVHIFFTYRPSELGRSTRTISEKKGKEKQTMWRVHGTCYLFHYPLHVIGQPSGPRILIGWGQMNQASVTTGPYCPGAVLYGIDGGLLIVQSVLIYEVHNTHTYKHMCTYTNYVKQMQERMVGTSYLP